ncbi:MAG TPA: hypothetical protein VKA46_31895 [Gemmataceae bacterium]|nr:hypothetical protein [Gemmataceae bacterium]
MRRFLMDTGIAQDFKQQLLRPGLPRHLQARHDWPRARLASSAIAVAGTIPSSSASTNADDPPQDAVASSRSPRRFLEQ